MPVPDDVCEAWVGVPEPVRGGGVLVPDPLEVCAAWVGVPDPVAPLEAAGMRTTLIPPKSAPPDHDHAGVVSPSGSHATPARRIPEGVDDSVKSASSIQPASCDRAVLFSIWMNDIGASPAPIPEIAGPHDVAPAPVAVVAASFGVVVSTPVAWTTAQPTPWKLPVSRSIEIVPDPDQLMHRHSSICRRDPQSVKPRFVHVPERPETVAAPPIPNDE